MADDPASAPSDLREWRKAQRAALLERRERAEAASRQRWSEAITRHLLAAFPMLRERIVGLYWPYRGEFDPRFTIRRLREAGARAALPIVVRKAAPLAFREWWPGAPMGRGVFDLPIPDGTAVVQPEALLIPPVGFDAKGYRLGYGGGYFDRTLAAMDPQPLKIGVAFELARIPTIFPQSYDIPMDFIVTEAGVHHAAEGGLVRIGDTAHASALAETIFAGRRGASRSPAEGA